MKYQSTRNAALTAMPSQAVLQGLAPDGGLYVLPNLRLDFDWQGTLRLDTLGMATKILSALLPDYANMDKLTQRAYAGKFETPDLTPLRQVGDNYVLELFRGPTSAFKDVALSMLPQLMVAAKGEEKIVILTATSGDTGKAALVGFQDVPGIDIIVFYPENGVSAVQKAQMVTQQGKNVHVCAIRGNFDDAQNGVKQVFSAVTQQNLLAGRKVRLSSANSINIGRLAPQVVYYFKAYADLEKKGHIRRGDAVDFVVPTGNFGDILAGFIAKQLGLPVGRLVCASNANNVLTEFIQTGHYDRRRPFYKTSSPSMDILISSNLERLLYSLSDGNAETVAALMQQLSQTGEYQIDASMLQRLQKDFWAGCCEEAGTSQTIGKLWREQQYLCDTHTAVAWNVAEQYRSATKTDAPLVVLSTASAYKFPAAVLKAIDGEACGDEFDQMEQLHRLTGVPIPAHLAKLRSQPVLHHDVINREEMLSYVLERAK